MYGKSKWEEGHELYGYGYCRLNNNVDVDAELWSKNCLDVT